MAQLHWGVVYGPVSSRRFGASLGVNLQPPDRKVCNFNCAYCQYGWSRLEAAGARPTQPAWPRRETVRRGVERVLREQVSSGHPLARLTIAGHGEPTLHPDFPAIVRDLRALRNRIAPSVPIAILSNGSTLDRPTIRKALSEVDERHVKLDAGDTVTLQRLNGASLPFERMLNGLTKLRDVYVQAMFVTDRAGHLDNSGHGAVSSWLAAVRAVRPREAHVCTIDQPPAFPFLKAVPRDRLESIAGRVRELDIPARVFA